MSPATAFALAWALAYAGLAAFGLAIERHHRQVRGRPLAAAARRRLRLAGSAPLLAALAILTAGWGWPVGSVLWTASLSTAALPLPFLFAYAPRAVLPSILALLLAALAAGSWSL